MSEGPDERVEEEGIEGGSARRGGWVIGEEEGGGVVNGVEGGGGGGEFGENEWVVDEAEFEDEGVDLGESGEGGAGVEES